VTAERADGEPLPISLVAHHVFCPRRAWLEATGEKTDTHQMAVGLDEHHASDDPAASRAGRLRAVEIASRHLGVIGRCDVVELDAAGAATVFAQETTGRRHAQDARPGSDAKSGAVLGSLRGQRPKGQVGSRRIGTLSPPLSGRPFIEAAGCWPR
jgi:CRISPR-associated protein Cas1